MSLRINQNVMSVRTHGQLSGTSGRLEKSIEKLSSGLRINRASDDAAGLAISEKLRRQVRGLSRAILNAQDGISMIQTAEGSLNESQSNLQRMRELAIQSANDTLTSNDRLEIQKEIVQLRDDLNRIATNTDFNTKRLLDGSQAATISSTSRFAKGIVTDAAVGGDYELSLTLVQAGVAQRMRSQIMINKDTGDIAKATTTLLSIAQLYDGNGSFALDTAKTLTVVGNSRTAEVAVNGGMTLGQLNDAIYQALRSEKGLAMDNAISDFVTTASSKIAGIGGYLDITSGVVGLKGDVSFAGDQAFIKALGISTIRQSADTVIQTTAKDVNGNTVTINTNDGRSVGVLQGIDLKFETQAATVAGLGGIQQGLRFSVGAGPYELRISFGSNFSWANADGGVTIDINEGAWTMDGLARRINFEIEADLGANSGVVARVVEGEIQLAYTPSAASLSDNIKIAASSDNVALENLGFRSGTYYGSITGKKLTDLEHRAAGFSAFNENFTQANGTVTYSVSTGLAGATWTHLATNDETVADMVEFNTFRRDFLSAQSAAFSGSVDMFQVGSSIVFATKSVGNKNNSDGTVITAQITLNISVSDATVTLHTASANIAAREIFKFWSDYTVGDSGEVKGVGDRNFRFHVVAETPQFHIGADQGQSMQVSMGNMSAEALGVDDLDMTSVKSSNIALGKINRALDKVSAERSKLGAYQNRLEYAINNLRNMHSNMVSSESRIRDADVAMEMIEFTRNQILNQSGTAMLAQANLVPQGVLQLLR
jgi:flagellin